MGHTGTQYFKQVVKLSQNKEIMLQLLLKLRLTAEDVKNSSQWETKKYNANDKHVLCSKHVRLLNSISVENSHLQLLKYRNKTTEFQKGRSWDTCKQFSV